MKMMTKLIGAVLLAGAASGCSNAQTSASYEIFDQWDNPARSKSRIYRQNLLPEDASELFSDVVFVHQFESGQRGGETEVTVTHFSASGESVECRVIPSRTYVWTAVIEPYWVESERQRASWPATRYNRTDGTTGVQSYQYNGETGQLTGFTYQSPFWWEGRVGHLQYDLPAMVYTVCPDFPSAASLGVEVNAAQTALTYDALVAQNPGRRVLRPDLVTPVTIRPWTADQ